MYLREAGVQILYNGANLEVASCFGISQRAFTSNIVFLDEDEEAPGAARMTLVYTCSERLVVFNMLTREQTFLPIETEGTITFLSTIRKREGLMYVFAERFLESAPVLVFYLSDKKQYHFMHAHLKPNSYLKQVKIPRDAATNKNICVTLSSFPHVLTVWKTDKQKLLTEKELKVQKPVFDQNPENPLQIVIAGNKYLRLWEVNFQEKCIDEAPLHLVHLKIERDTDFIDLKYLPGASTLLALSSDNKVFIFEGYEQTRVINNVFIPGNVGATGPAQDQFIAGINKQLGQVSPETAQAECLAVSRRGFFVGGTGGFISVFFFEESRPPLHIGTTQLSLSAVHTFSISISSDDQTLVCVCQKNVDVTEVEFTTGRSSLPQDEELPDLKLEFYLTNIKKLESELPDAVSALFPASQHFGAIKGVSMSHARNQIVTVGDDFHLRVWQRELEWTGVIDHKFSDHPLTVSVHPFGFEVAVGFKESFKVFFLLDDELYPVVDQVVKMCFGVAFSPGGRYLAANNGGTVFILSAYTLTMVTSYSSHSAPVHSLAWDTSGTLITSACFGGSVSVWDVLKCEQRTSTPSRQGKLLSCIYDDDLDLYIVLTAEGVVRVVIETTSRTFLLPTSNFRYTSMLLVKEINLLFLGTSTGVLRVALWPTFPSVDGDTFDFQDLKIHSKEILRIEASIPHEELVTVSADGSVFVHSLKVLMSGSRVPLAKAIMAGNNQHQNLMQFTPPDSKQLSFLSLVKRNTLDVLNDRIKELEDASSTVKSQHKYVLETLEKQAKEELEKQRVEYEEKLNFEREYINKVKKDMEAKEVEYKKNLESLEQLHQVEIEDLVRKHDASQSEEQERYDSLKDEMENMKLKMAKEVQNLMTMHKEVKQNIESECQIRLDQVKTAYETLLDSMKKQGEEYETGLLMTEKEYEEEMMVEKDKLSRRLTDTLEYVSNLKIVNNRLIAERENLSRRDEEMTKLNQDLEEMHSAARIENEELKTKLSKMQEQLVEREDVIKKKENTIKELRAFNIHLQNFRFVLDQKIKSLKDDRGPLGEQLSSLQGHIRSMYSELLEEFGNTKTTVKKATELQSKNKSLGELNAQLRNEAILAKRKVALIQSDLVQLVRVTNKDTLLFGLKQLIDKHLSMEELINGGAEAELAKAGTMSAEEANLAKVKHEVMYQHDLMKEQLAAIQRKTKNLETKSSGEVQRKMQENAALIKECNLLRNDINRLQRENAMLKDRGKLIRSQGREAESILPKVGKMKDTPFQQLKKTGSAMDIRGVDRQSIDKPRPVQTATRPELRIRTLISELEKNQNEIIEQNSQFRRLQEQVSTFLNQPDSLRPQRDSDEEESPFGIREVSPMHSGNEHLSHSSTQPILQTTTAGTDTSTMKPEGVTFNIQ